jgi:hypothetical protein
MVKSDCKMINTKYYTSKIIRRMVDKTIGRERLYSHILSNKLWQRLITTFNIDIGADYNQRKIIYDLNRIFQNNHKVKEGRSDSRILFIDPRGSYYTRIILGVISNRLRIHNVYSLFIDCEELPVCNGWTVLTPRPQEQCKYCLYNSNQLSDALNLDSKSLNEINDSWVRDEARRIVSDLSKDEIDNYNYMNLPLGKYLKVSANSYFLSGEVPDDQNSIIILRGLLEGLIILFHAYDKVLTDYKPDKIIIVNGRFFMHKLAYEMCKNRGIPVITLDDFGSTGGTGNRWMFSHDKAIAELDLNEYWRHWNDIALTKSEKTYLDENFIKGSVNNKIYYENPQLDWDIICSELKINRNSEFDVMFTNLTWDSTAIDKDICFNGMFDWVYTTIDEYIDNRKMLLIRVHPAEKEIFGRPSLQRVKDEILSRYKKLPDNIIIIPYGSNISSYQLLKESRLKIVYSSTLGLEAALRGLPIIVAGDVHYRGKGFTVDVQSKIEYIHFINNPKLIDKLTTDQIDIAYQYAFFYLYRTKIPLEFYSANMFKIQKMNIKSLQDILPGTNPYLDLVIEGILNNKPIILPRKLSNKLYKLH